MSTEIGGKTRHGRNDQSLAIPAFVIGGFGITAFAFREFLVKTISELYPAGASTPAHRRRAAPLRPA
jgi:hypothetical protein